MFQICIALDPPFCLIENPDPGSGIYYFPFIFISLYSIIKSHVKCNLNACEFMSGSGIRNRFFSGYRIPNLSFFVAVYISRMDKSQDPGSTSGSATLSLTTQKAETIFNIMYPTSSWNIAQCPHCILNDVLSNSRFSGKKCIGKRREINNA